MGLPKNTNKDSEVMDNAVVPGPYFGKHTDKQEGCLKMANPLRWFIG